MCPNLVQSVTVTDMAHYHVFDSIDQMKPEMEKYQAMKISSFIDLPDTEHNIQPRELSFFTRRGKPSVGGGTRIFWVVCGGQFFFTDSKGGGPDFFS